MVRSPKNYLHTMMLWKILWWITFIEILNNCCQDICSTVTPGTVCHLYWSFLCTLVNNIKNSVLVSCLVLLLSKCFDLELDYPTIYSTSEIGHRHSLLRRTIHTRTSGSHITFIAQCTVIESPWSFWAIFLPSW